jgi:Protein of unknown function (DUF2845)
MKRPSLVLLLTALAGTADADGLRCGNKLVSEGDTRSEVSAKCGDPTETDHSSIMAPAVTWIHGQPVQVGGGLIEIPVDVWVYNFGPNRLMSRIRFENGRVVAIETLGYGFQKDE